MKTFSFKLNKDSIAETNIPEEYFLNVCNFDRFKLSYRYNVFYSGECYGCKVNKEDFEKNAKILYLNTNSTENIVNKSNKVVFVKLNKQKAIKRAYSDEKEIYKDNIVNEDWTILFVVEDDNFLQCNLADKSKYVYLAFPKVYKMSRNKRKVFLSNEDLQENNKQNYQKAKEKRANISKKFEETNNGTIKFTTPKFEIVEINKSTDNVPDAKVGDVIYGEMTVLENGKNKVNVASVYVNYVTLYKNDVKVKILPPSVFGDIMANHFKLKQENKDFDKESI